MIVVDEQEDEEIEEDSFDSFPLESEILNTNLFLKRVFQTFLISLSVLPGRWDAILDHLKNKILYHINHDTKENNNNDAFFFLFYFQLEYFYLFPKAWCSFIMASSSSLVKFPLFTSGLR